MPAHVGACGLLAAGEHVRVTRDDSGRAHLHGVVSCGSVWLCPVCAGRIAFVRGQEVDQAIELGSTVGRDGAVLLTLTARHKRGQPLRELRAGITAAYQWLARGSPWERFKAAHSVTGTIRALEVTHGRNGWHAHLHVALSTADAEQLRETTDPGDQWPRYELARDHAWLVERWQRAVAEQMGAEHVPSAERGVNLQPCDRGGQYLSKMGLGVELAGSGKAGRRGSRTPWQIARDLVDHPNGHDLGLWSEYVEAMRHARHLTWSRGLKRRCAIVDRSDDELANDAPEGEHVLSIRRRDWAVLRAHSHKGLPAIVWILEAAEQQTPKRARALVVLLAKEARKKQKERGHPP